LRQQLPAFVSRRPHCADGRDFFDFCGGQTAKILHFCEVRNFFAYRL
jgi:hypothetical protein